MYLPLNPSMLCYLVAPVDGNVIFQYRLEAETLKGARGFSESGGPSAAFF